MGQPWGAQGSPVRTCLKAHSQGQGRGSLNGWIRPRALFPGVCSVFGVDSRLRIGMGDVYKCGSQVLC